jgi:hypothetical protein
MAVVIGLEDYLLPLTKNVGLLDRGCGMKFLKALAILLFGPLLGIVVAFILGSLALRPDANFITNGGHASPGDGFQVMGYVALSLVISVPLSILLAGVVVFRRPRDPSPTEEP